jgi:hypothetical protein
MHQNATVPEHQAAPQLLILAEPLLREGLMRLLEPGYRLASDPSERQGSIQLLVWSASSGMPIATLRHELQQLKERWQPAPLLLLVPGDVGYPSAELLQLPCEGLLQQAEPSEISDAVATLLAGGRVCELRPLSTTPADPEPIGLGQWLLRSGLQQVAAEQARCNTLLKRHNGGLNRILLQGRLRELAAAKALLLWLWGPISMAFPQEPAQPAEQPTAQGVAITLRERTAIGVWNAIHHRLSSAIEGGLDNRSGQLLALEGLSIENRRDLLLALLNQLDLLIHHLRHNQLRGEELEQRWLQQQPELRRLSLRAMAGEYVQLPMQGGLLPVAEQLSSSSDLSGVDPDLPLAMPMLATLVQAQPVLVDGRLLAPDEPQAVLHLELLIANWLIRSAELISADILSSCSNWPELRRYLLRDDLLATRNLERLRNQLNAQQRWDSLFERPVQLYQSQRMLFRLQAGAITPLLLTEPRDGELRDLSWSQQLITLALEARDALSPQLQKLIRQCGDLLVVVLTQVIGRAIGLVGRGILQGMGRTVGRG